MKNFIYNTFYTIIKAKDSLFKPKQAVLNKNIKELPFIVLITSFNNVRYCIENLKSVIEQDYKNYTVIYVDDCSEDDTVRLVEEFLLQNDLSNKVKLVKNNVRQKKLANLYDTISNIKDEQSIVIELDGDDYFAHKNVLKTFNNYYQSTGALVAYASYENSPKVLADRLKLQVYCFSTPSFVVKYNLFRKYPWVYSGLRSYKVGIFKKINKIDLIQKDTNIFYPVCHDMAMFYPMLEMACERVAFIPEALLIRNIDSPINDFKSYDNSFRINIMKEIKNAEKYKRLS